MLQGKTVILGVTGSIAAYKIATLASSLVKLHADVHVIMTQNATHFITPITFETLTGNKCLVDTFDRNFQFHVAHVSLAQRADIMLIAPASANVIGKIANGIADDMLTTTVMACTAPVLISPAMNTHMYENPIVQDNLDKLRRFGYTVIEPAVGMLACRDVGAGKMPEPEVLLDYILREIACEKDLKGKKLLVTAGPTQEALDPVRYLTNHSTGKMGYAIARRAMLRGAEVTLVTGPTSLAPPPFVEVVPVTSAAEMFDAVTSRAPDQDAIIKSAAVADYRPAEIASEKQKKHDGEMQIPLTRTQDILAYLGEHKRDGQFLCGFSMETQNMLENSREKLKRKHLDMICANNLKVSGAGFGTDTNVVTLIQKDSERELPLLSKEAVGDAILDVIRDFWHNA
ncbi:bifunctional phosphopantothenoylcysteine decarboxylase/phosphopantothenate--cysteine ligase CoaBC [uncultured Ruminococcus sp.]|uniref:bifunctional phosphopantothenoylcysteine decarboxylase/phosphopantothenate--cysteine ligase CoaBC n=1 Tax=uncultured Ruminococcus sp. TaxID=165186 RepID=UPI0026028A96|nr:bifunctional phosphopantothenoylcysteine decarboxylase/phosphopantothenate--cysteine ligase CoaBC [uncultured Ruminococcus sp.]